MYVCERCLRAIESREGLQCRIAESFSGCEDNEYLSKCEWCGESGFSQLYRLVNYSDQNAGGIDDLG